MRKLQRARAPRLLIPAFAALMSALPGCNGSTDDFERAKSGEPLKTPSQVLREAEAKYGTPKKPSAPTVTPKDAPK
jgi:hypothetical protein